MTVVPSSIPIDPHARKGDCVFCPLCGSPTAIDTGERWLGTVMVISCGCKWESNTATAVRNEADTDWIYLVRGPRKIEFVSWTNFGKK